MEVCAAKQQNSALMGTDWQHEGADLASLLLEFGGVESGPPPSRVGDRLRLLTVQSNHGLEIWRIAGTNSAHMHAFVSNQYERVVKDNHQE